MAVRTSKTMDGHTIQYVLDLAVEVSNPCEWNEPCEQCFCS